MTRGMALWILGAGGHGRVVADAARSQGGWSEILFFDDSPRGEQVDGLRVAGGSSAFFEAAEAARIVAIGDNRCRDALSARCTAAGLMLATVVHGQACVSPGSVIGPGSFVAAMAVVGPGVRLGRACIVNTSASVDHDCILGDAVHVSPGAHLGGGVVVGHRTWVGIGAAIRHAEVIGDDAMVAAGAVVVAPVADNAQVAGVPARSRVDEPNA